MIKVLEKKVWYRRVGLNESYADEGSDENQWRSYDAKTKHKVNACDRTRPWTHEARTPSPKKKVRKAKSARSSSAYLTATCN
jgi:hypothetical protein